MALVCGWITGRLGLCASLYLAAVVAWQVRNLIRFEHWLRLRSSYRRWLPVSYLVGAMVPLLALLGFWGAGFELSKAAAAARIDARVF